MNTNKLREALEELIQQRSILDEAIANLRKTIALVSGPTQPITSPQSNNAERSYIDDAVEVIREAGANLHIDDLVKRISKRRGQQIDRPPIESSLSRHITKTKNSRVIRTKPGYYGLPEWESTPMDDRANIDVKEHAA